MQNEMKDMSQVTMIDPVTQEASISPTQNFAVTLKAILHHEKWTMSLWISSDVSPQDLAKLWNTNCEVRFRDGEYHLYPTTSAQHVDEHNLLIVMADQPMTVYTCHAKDLSAYCAKNFGHGEFFDQFGPIAENTISGHDPFLMTSPMKHGNTPVDVLTTLAAFQNCSEVYHYGIAQDKGICTIKGDLTSRRLIASVLASALTKSTLQELGRHVPIIHQDHTTEVVFASAEHRVAAPPHVFPTCVATALTRMMLDTLATDDGIANYLNRGSGPLWTGHMDKNVSAEILTSILQYTFSPVAHLKAVRLII